MSGSRAADSAHLFHNEDLAAGAFLNYLGSGDPDANVISTVSRTVYALEDP